MKRSLPIVLSLITLPALAEGTRELDSHEHGVSTLELAIDGAVVAMNLTSPGMDIVGFEYEASSDADKDAVEAAVRTMLTPENLIALPDAAECRLTEVLAHLHGSGAGHHHEEEHAEGEHEDHDDHDEHAEGDGHDGHDDHDDHNDHAEGEDHDAHEEAEHNEFHARYIFACEHPEKLTTIGFPFFEKFENAKEIEAQYVTSAGAGAAEIGRDAPELKLD